MDQPRRSRIPHATAGPRPSVARVLAALWLAVGLAAALAVGLAPGLPAFALEKIDFRTPGAPDALAKSLRAASALLAAEQEKTTDPQDLGAAARAEYGRLLAAFYDDGYYSATISVKINGQEAADLAALNAPDTITSITVTAVPGPQFAFSRAEIAPLAPGTLLPPRFAVGRIARSGIMAEAVGAAIDAWRSAGHAKAAAAGQEIVADHAAQKLAARFALAPGPVVHFGTFTLKGQSDVRPARIRAIAGFPTGQIFDPAAAERSANRLRRIGAFRSVTLEEAGTLGPGDTLDVEATILDQPKRHLSLGVEVASLDGAALTAGWLHRNLLGGAEQLRLDGAISGIGGANSGADYTLGARLSRPGTPDPDTEAYVGASLAHEDEETSVSDSGTIGIGFSRVLNDKLTADVGLAFGFERTKDALGTAQFSTLSLPLGLSWDRRNLPLNATKGFLIDLKVKPFLGFSGTGSGARIAFDTRGFHGFGAERRLVVAARLQGGLVAGSALLATPRGDLFYSGGGGTVRGHPYRSLGVTTACGAGCSVETGGRSFFGASGEVRLTTGTNLGIVAFADAGFISADVFGPGAWQSGAGLGLRYNTGIGPIRLDVAQPISGTTAKGTQFYIGIGQAF